jgi:DNA-binding SARP family transcriptional activator
MNRDVSSSTCCPESTQKQIEHIIQGHARYQAFFFGPFRITRAGQPLGESGWRRNKAKALLKWFLLNPGDLFAAEQLSKLFWPECSTKVATNNLHVTLHYLRRVLEPELAPGQPSSFVRRNRHNYYWFDHKDSWWSDVDEVHRLSACMKEAERTGDHVQTLRYAQALLNYYRLGFLPEDIYEDIFAPYRRQHEYASIQLLTNLLSLYTQFTQLDEAFSCALQLLSLDPYNENALKTMVHIYVYQGNIAGALRQLDDFQRSLKDDLGIEPEEELLALRDTILGVR